MRNWRQLATVGWVQNKLTRCGIDTPPWISENSTLSLDAIWLQREKSTEKSIHRQGVQYKSQNIQSVF